VIADAWGATALAVSETLAPATAVAGVAAAEVQVAQLTGVPLTTTAPESAPPSVPVLVQARKTLTSVVCCAVTLKGADVPTHETEPSGEVALSVIVYPLPAGTFGMKKLIVVAAAGTAYVPVSTVVAPWLIVQLTLVIVSPPGSVSSMLTFPNDCSPGG
jgi:hypothetical protein